MNAPAFAPDETAALPPAFLVGLVGSGIQASRSPALHEREGAAQGLRYIYRLFDFDVLKAGLDSLPRILDMAQALGFAGLNITHPAKQAVLPLLDEVSPDARALGAVNTVVLRDGRRIGHNTDHSGFAEGFRRGLPDAVMGEVVQLGAGGAGAAVAHAALSLGAQRLTLLDMDPAKAAGLAESLNAHFGPGRARAATDITAAMRGADGLIHATPTGMAKYPGLPLPEDLLHPRLWVAEVVYVPLETQLVRTARARGCRVVDGGGMAVFQAVGAFRLFTGLEPDAERMLRHFTRMMAG
ncbi:shikimate dehydrogenase [Roseomonas sp. GC11]|uniref:shikimate dehydrogenase n=1 Tax=Roseomonas sp. GC11 TaxID=2950546 RepID=UPI00210D8D89|nr:shikimate dehydrogenase [Roseomonas sp. GC11]MCQ4159618.1 shikimate dehydrogenase [Roseomonas sp. GC11]